MIKSKNIFAKLLHAFANKKSPSFCNIAEGTHAGNITMIAAEDIDTANLIVKTGANANEILIAGIADKPLGVCNDQGSKGDVLNVAIAGSAESTFMCVCSSGATYGDTLYTAANGKVSTVVGNGASKIGIALCSCAANGIVEIDPQGFGSKAWQIADCGVFTWTGSTTSATMTNTAIYSTDSVFASVAVSGGSEKIVKAVAANGSATFTLDAAGTQDTTKISWFIIRKN